MGGKAWAIWVEGMLVEFLILKVSVISGRSYTEVQCYQESLEHDPRHAIAWRCLGAAGGGTVDGKVYTQDQCYEEYAKLDPTRKAAKAWYHLGVAGGGTFGGRTYTQAECYQESLKH